MTSRTRGRLTVAVVLGLLTLPAEAILLPVARTPDVAVAALDWSADLAGRTGEASLEIDAYPLAYRRAIMTQLAPEVGRRRGRNTFAATSARTRNSHRRRSALQTRLRCCHPKRSRRRVAGCKGIIKDLNRHRRRPRCRRAVRDAWTEEARARERPCHWRQQLADSRPRCARPAGHSAATATSTSTKKTRTDPWLQCSELYTCNFDLNWPMCGPVWAWACTGWCKILRWPDPLY